MTRTEIAARVGSVQFDLASGGRRLDAEKELIRLRKEIVAGGMGEEVDQRILEGYRANAVAQLDRLRELLSELDLRTAPDMELFHLSACCELARQEVVHYLHLRNGAAAGRVQEVLPCQD